MKTVIALLMVAFTLIAAGQGTVVLSDQPRDVFIQDQTSEPVELFLFLNEGEIELAEEIQVDETSFAVVAGHTITAGDIVCFQDSLSFTQARVLSVDVDTITVDMPFDRHYSINAGCAYGTSNLAINASSETKIFQISPENMIDGYAWDITRMIIVITDGSAMDDGKLGGITALTKGITFRVSDGVNKNIFNVKKNADFRLTAFDLSYVDATLGPSGQYSLGVRKSFGGQDKFGVVLRLHSFTNDKFQAILSEDLSGLILFEIKIQGHVVEY